MPLHLAFAHMIREGVCGDSPGRGQQWPQHTLAPGLCTHGGVPASNEGRTIVLGRESTVRMHTHLFKLLFAPRFAASASRPQHVCAAQQVTSATVQQEGARKALVTLPLSVQSQNGFCNSGSPGA